MYYFENEGSITNWENCFFTPLEEHLSCAKITGNLYQMKSVLGKHGNK